jgi:uncharacterized protein YcfJ
MMASMESTVKTTGGVDMVETTNAVETVEPGEPAAKCRPDLIAEARPIDETRPIGVVPIGVVSIGVVGSSGLRARCERSQQDH